MPSRPEEPLGNVLARLEQVYYGNRDNVKTSTSAVPSSSTSSISTSPPKANASTSSIASPNGKAASDSLSSLEDGLGPEGESMLPLLVAVALIANNSPEDYAAIFEYFATKSPYQDRTPEALAKLVLRLRTALFKGVPLFGVPRIINASASLQTAVLAHPQGWKILHKIPMVSTKPNKTTTEQDSVVGWRFFKAIYERHAEPIFTRINAMSPDLAEMIVDDLYGANLARTEVLTWKETVLIEFVGCASLDCPAQAKGHFYGAKNVGVLRKDMANAVEVVRQVSAWLGEPSILDRMSFIKALDGWPSYWPWLGPPNRQSRGSPTPAPR